FTTSGSSLTRCSTGGSFPPVTCSASIGASEYCAASAGPHSAASTPAYNNLFTLFIIFLPAAALKLTFSRYCRPFFLLGLPLFQKTYPGWHVLTVVAPDAPADEIA